MSESIDLPRALRCPFCASDKFVVRCGHGPEQFSAQVRCIDCEARGPLAPWSGTQEASMINAIEAWNGRKGLCPPE